VIGKRFSHLASNHAKSAKSSFLQAKSQEIGAYTPIDGKPQLKDN